MIITIIMYDNGKQIPVQLDTDDLPAWAERWTDERIIGM